MSTGTLCAGDWGVDGWAGQGPGSIYLAVVLRIALETLLFQTEDSSFRATGHFSGLRCLWLAGSGGIEAFKSKQLRLSDRFATHDRPGPSLHSTYRQDPTSLHHPKPKSGDPRGRSPTCPKTSSNRLHRPSALKYPPTVRTYKPYKP